MSTAYPWPSRRAAEQMPRASETLTDEQIAQLQADVRRDVDEATRFDPLFFAIALIALVSAFGLIAPHFGG